MRVCARAEWKKLWKYSSKLKINFYLSTENEKRTVRRAGVCGDEIFLAGTVDCAPLARRFISSLYSPPPASYIVCLVSN